MSHVQTLPMYAVPNVLMRFPNTFRDFTIRISGSSKYLIDDIYYRIKDRTKAVVISAGEMIRTSKSAIIYINFSERYIEIISPKIYEIYRICEEYN